MACDLPCISYMALYVISMHIVNSNSRSSSSQHWKLNLSAGKVEPAKAQPAAKNGTVSSSGHGSRSGGSNSSTSPDSSNNNTSYNSSNDIDLSENMLDDRMMEILTNKVVSEGEWMVSSPFSGDGDSGSYVDDSDNFDCDSARRGVADSNSHHPKKCKDSNSRPTDRKGTSSDKSTDSKGGKTSKTYKPLTCGKKVNMTQYDHLRGISERHLHSHIPEPDVAMVFQRDGRSSEVDMTDLEQKLRKAKKDVEKAGSSQKEQSAQVYNLIGNFWRIKGNTQTSIECFRKALSILPEDPDILLNLARVLFNLQYLDDAIFLARRSLHLQPSEQNSWLQHYTLGEILKSYGHAQEAAMHFHQALELNPGFQPAKSHLRDLDSEPAPSVTHLTLFIILFLVIGVLFGVVTSIESNFQDSGTGEGSKTQQRHFNRAMAMRSIKLGINPRLCRLRKANG